MQLYKFCIEPEIDYKKERDVREARYFYFGKNKILHAWIVEQKQKKTTIKALKEVKPGEVAQLDFVKIDIPIKLYGLDTNGTLLGKTKYGTLSFNFREEKITTISNRVLHSHKIEQRGSHDATFQSMLPGMNLSDEFNTKNATFRRHETKSKGVYQEPYYPEAVLIGSTNNPNEENTNSTYVAIGNSQINLKLDLIQKPDKNIFEFPIINFIVDHHPACQKTLLIGWNRSILQAVSLEESKHKAAFIQTKLEKLESLRDCLLEDASTPFVDKEGRIGIWKDLANIGTYYAWKRES